MDEIKNENLDSEIEETDVDLFDDETDDIESLKSKLTESESKRKQLFERAKKAEGFELKDGKWVKQEPKPEVKPETKKEEGLSQTDFYALIKADVHEDDISEITDYAKLKKISIPDALKSNYVKTYLADRREERETANNTATGNVRRGPAKPNASQILERARKGELPETDEEMAMLVKAEFENK